MGCSLRRLAPRGTSTSCSRAGGDRVRSVSVHPSTPRARLGDPVVDSARDVIARVLSTGYPPIRAIAGALDMSVRTFQRRLASSGRTCKKLVDEVRLAEARRALAASKAPLKSIALDLGFAEQASFTRAFRRWTGESPSEYRKRQVRLNGEAHRPSPSTSIPIESPGPDLPPGGVPEGGQVSPSSGDGPAPRRGKTSGLELARNGQLCGAQWPDGVNARIHTPR
jgi:AraC-like DNA-binding protein